MIPITMADHHFFTDAFTKAFLKTSNNINTNQPATMF